MWAELGPKPTAVAGDAGPSTRQDGVSQQDGPRWTPSDDQRAHRSVAICGSMGY
jgi:hypothetical protein